MDIGYKERRIIALSIYSDAYLNNPKLTRSLGRRTLAIAIMIKPTVKTARRRRKPHSMPIRNPAVPIDIAANRLDMAMVILVTLNPYVEGKVGILAVL